MDPVRGGCEHSRGANRADIRLTFTPLSKPAFVAADFKATLKLIITITSSPPPPPPPPPLLPSSHRPTYDSSYERDEHGEERGRTGTRNRQRPEKREKRRTVSKQPTTTTH